MKSPRILSLLLVAGLSGCVIVADGDDWDDHDNWRETQSYNRAAIADLALGTPVNEVRERLGAPEFSEGVSQNGRDFLVLRYRTQHRHSDGDTTADETTPLVFENGRLVGWGDVALQSIPGIARHAYN